MESKSKYIATEIAEKFDMNYQTVHKRMTSPYADKRWGVQTEELPDGSIRRYVPEEKLNLWEQDFDYRGRPVFRK